MKRFLKQTKKGNNKGFTLVELIVVIAILAILAVALTPKLTHYIDKARKSNDYEAVNSMKTAIELALIEDDTYKSIAAISTNPVVGEYIVLASSDDSNELSFTTVYNGNDAMTKVINEIKSVVIGDTSASKITLQSDDAKGKDNYIILHIENQYKFELYLFYDQAGKPTTTTDADGNKVLSGYDHIAEQN